jgi:hypothetical protein
LEAEKERSDGLTREVAAIKAIAAELERNSSTPIRPKQGQGQGQGQGHLMDASELFGGDEQEPDALHMQQEEQLATMKIQVEVLSRDCAQARAAMAAAEAELVKERHAAAGREQLQAKLLILQQQLTQTSENNSATANGMANGSKTTTGSRFLQSNSSLSGSPGQKDTTAAHVFSGASANATVSSRVYGELLAERKKLRALQDEFSDLMGLIAQQELELDVFRTSLETNVGSEAVAKAEEDAEDAAIKRYGFYNNFRKEGSDGEGDGEEVEGETLFAPADGANDVVYGYA